MSVKRNCLVCDKEFEPCVTCNRDIPEELQWRRVVCCPAHFHYHLPIIKYVRNEITKSEAKEMLQNAIDTYGKIKFCDNIKAIAEEILTEDAPAEDIVEDIKGKAVISKINLSKNRK